MLNSQRVRRLLIKTSKAAPTAGRSLRKTYGFDTFCTNVNSACVKSRLPSLKRGPQKALVLFKERLGLRGPSQMARRLRQAGGRGLRRLRQGCGGPAAHPWARPRRECKRGPGRLYAAFEGGRINERGVGTGKCCLALERKDIPTRATKPRNHAGHEGTDPARALAGVPGSTGRNVARRPWGRGWGMRSGKTLKLEGWTGRRPHGCPRLDGHSRAASTPPRQTGETDSAGTNAASPRAASARAGQRWPQNRAGP